ncbi:alpha-2-macroglobulin family protein [Wenyingzhuangia sp. IMCC45574]
MKKIFFLVFVSITILVSAQSPSKTYQKLWQKVQIDELDLLPKSALQKVDEIYKLAKKEQNEQQQIRCLIYQSKFSLALEENAQLKVVKNFKAAIVHTKSKANKAILNSMLAHLYWGYYNRNRWKIYNRTKVTGTDLGDDIKKWDVSKLIQETKKCFKASLVDEDLLQTLSVKDYEELVDVKENVSFYRPTLYDFLAHRAIQFYKDTQSSITQPKEPFLIDDVSYLEEIETIELKTKDVDSNKFLTLQLFQKLIQYHHKKGNREAYFKVLFQALEYIKDRSVFSTDRNVKLDLLEKLTKEYPLTKENNLLYFEIAKTKYGLFKYKESLALCNQIIENDSLSSAAINSKDIKRNILRQKLDTRIESYIPVNKKSKALITHRNIKEVSFSIVELSKQVSDSLYNNRKISKKTDFIKRIPKLLEWKEILKEVKDYKEHQTEVLIPELSQGKYLLIGKAKGQNNYSFKEFQVTNLSFLKLKDGMFQVVDRWTGAPVANAKVNLYQKKDRWMKRGLNKNFVTDANGAFVYPSKYRFYSVRATVSTDNDKAVFNSFSVDKDYDNDDEEEIEDKAFVFTDRSIYRPGQTVYFKIIWIRKKGQQVSPVVNENIEILVEGPNGDEVKELELTLNEYGTVAGSFTLPKTGLTGRYRFELDEDFDEYIDDLRTYNDTFSVEEYKRPKFETAFNPVKESFKVNDSVKAVGTATALAGSNITDAKVKYRVVRKAKYPRWCWWMPRVNNRQEIVQGETTTDANGKYTVPFKAIPDPTIDKKSQPTFYYTVYADVTDVNGETRSTETEVKVGYHTMSLSLTTLDQLEVSRKDHEIHISTENLNGEVVAAKGALKIYKLIAPTFPQKNRAWNKPEYSNISKEDYNIYFPNETFENVENPNKWEKGELVFNRKFDTAKEKSIAFKRIKRWKTGKYLIVAESKDAWGQEVIDEKIIDLVDKKAKKVADQQLFHLSLDKESYQPKDFVELSIGSGSKDMTVYVEVEKNYQTFSKHTIHLNNDIKRLKIPVSEFDRGGFAIKWHYVNLNTVKSGVQIVSVPYKPMDLKIETLTFRDKLEPGAKQKWSFKVTGADKEKVTAELLASMYDASLDQFKKHRWNFNLRNLETYRAYNYISSHLSFGTKTIHIIPRSYRSYYYSHSIRANEFKWYGFSFVGNKSKNSNYLSSIKLERIEYDGEAMGVVTDVNNKPLIGVSVSIKGTNYNAITDFDGNFKIKAKKGDVLVFEFIGYKTAKFKWESKSGFKMVLNLGSSALDEIVVVGYGSQKKKELTGTVTVVKAEKLAKSGVADVEQALQGQVAGVNVVASSGAPGEESNVLIRGYTSLLGGDKSPLYVVDGVPYDKDPKLNIAEIESIDVIKDAASVAIYGARGANGVIIITTKAGLKKQEQALANVKARTNFNETAFFFPQLKTNEKGEVSFEFTMPEDLTRWKLQLLAHDKRLYTGYKSLTTVTQKQLMVIPNTPRFLREGDEITLSTKISNLGDEFQQGRVKLELTDAITGKNVDGLLQNTEASQAFSVAKKGNTSVSWNLQIPENVSAVQYKIVAASNEFSDGEQNVLPVLSNRMLVTETLPLWVNGGQTKTFTLDALKNNTSRTLKHHQVSLEITSNPAWYAVQALPYLMEYPHECAEQTFSRYYANQLASHIVNTNPKVKEVFQQWASSEALVSNLEKNPELKSIIIQETPWLRSAQSETEQKKRMALLFDLSKMEGNLDSAVKKLDKMQMGNGGFPWFTGSDYANPYITQHVVQGYCHLKQLGVEIEGKKVEKMITKAQQFLDEELLARYQRLLKRAAELKNKAETEKEGIQKSQSYLARKHLYSFELQYLYVLSFNPSKKKEGQLQEAIAYYTNQAKEFWKEETLYDKGLLALIHYRNGKQKVANSIVKSLKENSVLSEEMGRYWKENKASWFWYRDPIVTQSLLIEVFSEIEDNTLFVDELKQWLLKNKQVQRWKTTKATTEAVYALLLQGSDWLSVEETVDVKIGGKPIPAEKMNAVKVEAGTGYFKTIWKANEISSDLGEVTLTKKQKGVAWGGLYWQYFEDLDKIQQSETPLSIKKEVYLKKNTDNGPTLVSLDDTSLKVGDLLTVRIELTTDRKMEFIHMKDMRAAGLEPVDVISKYKWQDGLGYYQSTKDAATHFFFDRIRKGTYVFEYDLRVSHKGVFSNGITNIESMYAPEFSSHSKGIKIKVEN